MPTTSIRSTSLPPNASLSARLYRLVPAFDSLRTYTAADARADLVAGLTVAAATVR